MNMARSDGSLTILDRGAMARGLVRWAVLGAAGVIALIIALSHSMSAGAAAPLGYDTNCVAINYTTCVAPGGGYVVPNTAAAPAGGAYLVSSYPDPRYCGGVVNVWNEGGNLINRCPDGTRVYPVFADYGYGYGYGGYGLGYVAGNYAPYANNYVYNGYYNGNGNFCNVNVNCNVFPAGGTNVGGVIYYNDNRFCSDGKVAFVPGQGYFCQNGGPLYANGNVPVNNIFGYGGYGGYAWPSYRFLENSTDTATTAPAPTPAVASAPVATTSTTVVTAAPVQQVAVAPAPAPAPTAQVATGLSASTQTQTQAPTVDAAGAGVKIMSIQSATTPVTTQNDGRDDSK